MVCVCSILLCLYRLTLCVVFGDCDGCGALDGVDFVIPIVSCIFDDSADCGFSIDVGELNFVFGSLSVRSIRVLYRSVFGS